jgi:Family of unknown function (DUF6221)
VSNPSDHLKHLLRVLAELETQQPGLAGDALLANKARQHEVREILDRLVAGALAGPASSPALAAFLFARIDEDEAAGQAAVKSVESARVMSEVRVKQHIVERVALAASGPDPGLAEMSRDVMLMLAEVYCGHPDYQPEWTRWNPGEPDTQWT